jgi:diguanylate cyclase (GGDEF)-like protein
MAEKLRKVIAGHAFPHKDSVTVSLGVTTMSKDDTIESIIHRADEALYKAKHKGRNRVEKK